MQLANQEAQRFNHEYIAPEHIFIGLIKEGTGVGANVMKNLNVNLRRARMEMEKHVKSGPEMITMGKLPQTPHAKQLIQFAIDEAHELGHHFVGTEHLLLATVQIAEEHPDSSTGSVMQELNLDLENVREEVLALLGFGSKAPTQKRGTGKKITRNQKLREARKKKRAQKRGERRLNDRALDAIHAARMVARKLQHHELGSHHLLLGVLFHGDNDAAAYLKREHDISYSDAMIKTAELFPPSADQHPSQFRLPLSDDYSKAIASAKEVSRKVINAELLMKGILLAANTDDGSNAGKVLTGLGLDIANLQPQIETFGDQAKNEQACEQDLLDELYYKANETSELDAFSHNLNAMVRFDSRVPIAVEPDVLDRIETTLLRRKRNNVLIVGSLERADVYFAAIARRFVDAEQHSPFYRNRLVELCGSSHPQKSYTNTLVASLNEAIRDLKTVVAIQEIDGLVAMDSPIFDRQNLWETMSKWFQLPTLRIMASCESDKHERLKQAGETYREFEVIELEEQTQPLVKDLIAREVHDLADHHLCLFDPEAVEVAQKLAQTFAPDDSELSHAVLLLDQTAALRQQPAHVADKDRQQLHRMDRGLRWLNHCQQVELDGGKYQKARRLVEQFDDAMRRRMEIEPLPTIDASKVIDVFCQTSGLDSAIVREKIDYPD